MSKGNSIPESAKRKRREVFLSDDDIKMAHEKAGLPIIEGLKGNRNEAIRWCIENAPKKQTAKK